MEDNLIDYNVITGPFAAHLTHTSLEIYFGKA